MWILLLLLLEVEARPRPADVRLTELEARAKNDATPELLLELGWAYFDKARREASDRYYLEAVRCGRRVDSHEGRQLEAQGLLNLHEFQAAETLARELLKKHSSPENYQILGDALMEQGKLQQAASAYEELMERAPGPGAYGRAAHLRWLTGDGAGAARLATLAARGSKAANAAWFWGRAASYQLSSAAIELAQQSAARSLSNGRECVSALFVAGRVALARENYEAALKHLQQAAEIQPLPETLWALSEVLDALGRTEDAQCARERIRASGLKVDPRGVALFLATVDRQGARAVSLAERELRSRRDAYTLDALAWAKWHAGYKEQARALIEGVMDTGIRDPRILYHAAVIGSDDPDSHRSWKKQARNLAAALLPSERRDLELLLDSSEVDR